MAVSQPIYGARVGETDQYGAPEIRNARLGVLPLGLPPGEVSLRAQVFIAGHQPTVNFTFLALPTGDKNFVFGEGDVTQTLRIRGDDHAVVGEPAVHTAAQSVRPVGLDSLASTPPSVIHAEQFLGWLFNFVDPPPAPDGWHFYWGDNKRYIRAAGFLSGQPGAPELRMPVVIRPVGISPSDVSNPQVWLTSVLEGWDFKFLDPRPPLSYNFVFGEQAAQQVFARGFTALEVGEHVVRTAAQTISPEGWRSAVVSTAFVGWERRGRWPFYFTQGYTRPNAKNVPFIFAGGRQIDVGGWDSSEFGQHIVRLNRTEIYPVGIWPATQFGTAEVSLRGDKIKPPGWDSGVVGEPSIFKPIVAHGWDSMVFQNNTVVYNWIQEIHTYPFLDQPPVPSDKAVVMNRTQYLYMQGGASKAEYGTPKVTNEFQAIKPTMMAPSSKWGTAWLSFSPRTVGPEIGRASCRERV